MCWKSVLRLILLGLVLRQATCQNCRELSDRVQLSATPPAECIELQRQCFGMAQLTEHLVGTTISFTACPMHVPGPITFTNQPGSQSSETPISSGGNITISGRTLTISNIRPEDEGQYRCHGGSFSPTIGCLVVSGLARFRTCDIEFNFEYTLVPSPDNSCSQELNVTEGTTVTFDTRLQFGSQGECECIEDVRLLALRREHPSLGDTVFVCDENVENCVSKSGVTVIRNNGQQQSGSGQPYDFSLVLPSVNMNHSGTYYAQVEVGQPGVGSTRSFWKIFEVTVNPGPTTPPPTTTATEDSTSTQPTTPDVTSSVTGVEGTPSEVRMDQGGAIAGGVIAALVVVLLVLVIAVVLVTHNRKRTHFVSGSSVEKEKQPVLVSLETTVSIARAQGEKDPPPAGDGDPNSVTVTRRVPGDPSPVGTKNGDNRVSVFVEVRNSVFLTTQLESEEQLHI